MYVHTSTSKIVTFSTYSTYIEAKKVKIKLKLNDYDT